MKRLLIFVTLVCFASAANATVISIYDTSGDDPVAVGNLEYTRAYDAAHDLDKIEITVGSWLGSDHSGGGKVINLDGAWSVSGQSNAGIWLGNPAGYSWTEDTAGYTFHGEYIVPDAPQSYVNFDSIVSGSSWGREIVSGNMYSSFEGGWNASSSAYWRGNGDVLATLYVTPNADVTFTAAGDPDVFGTSAGAFKSCTFTTAPIPEPSSLALLAGGLFGLAAYAWRKRK